MIDRSDEETGELVKAWLRRYLPAIVLGIAIALGILYFLDWRKNHQRTADHRLSYQLEQLQDAVSSGKFDDAKAAYTEDLQSSSSPAGSLAALIMAGVYSETGDKAAVKPALEKAIKAKDELVVQRAKFELAGLKADEKDYDGALQMLQGMENSAFAPAVRTLQGDIYYAQGKLKEALSVYQEAQKIAPSSMIEMRIKQLQTAVNVNQ